MFISLMQPGIAELKLVSRKLGAHMPTARQRGDMDCS